MEERNSSASRETEALIQDISLMAQQINRRFIPDPEKRRLFEQAVAPALDVVETAGTSAAADQS